MDSMRHVRRVARGAPHPTTARRACAARRAAGAALGALLLASHVTATRAQEAFASQRTAGFTLQNGVVYWHGGCGDDFSGPTSYLRGKASDALPGAAASLLFQPTGCTSDRIASANVAFDSLYAYWITGDGRVVRRSLAAPLPTRPDSVAQAGRRSLSGVPSCCWVAVDARYIYWSEETRVFRVPKGGGAVDPILAGGAALRDLRAGDDGKLLVLDGDRLKALAPVPGARTPSYLPIAIADHVSAYAIGNGRVYWATTAPGAFMVASKESGSFADMRTHYRAAGPAGLTVDNLGVDAANLYWHGRQAHGPAGPLFRLPLAGGTPMQLTSDLAAAPAPLQSDGRWLFWANHDAGVYRLDLGTRVAFRPTGNVAITGVEVTQAIQASGNEIPLVGYKPTVVRVYVQSTNDSNGPWAGVSARLDVRGSTHVHGAAPITVSPSGSDRARFDDSFTFLMDPSETAPGDRDVTVTLLPPLGRPQTRTDDDARTVHVQFGPARYLTVYVWTYANAHNGVDTVRDPRGQTCVSLGAAPDSVFRPYSDAELHRRYLENAFPVSGVTFVELPGSGTRYFDNSYCTAYDAAHRALDEIVDTRWPHGAVRALSLQPDQAGPFGWCCAGSNGNQTIRSWDYVAEPGATVSQEFGHSYGGVYASWHTWDPEAGYPRTDGVLGSIHDGVIGPFVGLKLWPALQAIPGQDTAGNPAAWDFMSYSQAPHWVSPYTYCKLLDYMSNGSQHCPASVEGGRAALSADGGLVFRLASRRVGGDGRDSLGDASARAPVAEREWLYLTGTAYPDGRVVLGPSRVMRAAMPAPASPAALRGAGRGPTPAAGETIAVSAESADGKSLGTTTVQLRPFNPHHFPAGSIGGVANTFSAFVPWDAAAVRVRLRRRGAVVAERTLSAHAPTLVVQPLAAGVPMTGKRELRWRGADADGDTLRYAVSYSPDGGQTWWPIAAQLVDARATVDLDKLPGGERPTLRVIAADGIRTVESDTPLPAPVPWKAPRVTLDVKDGSVFPANADFLVSGSASDVQDGAIDDPSAYAWSADKGERLGTGRWVVPHLSPGAHLLTLRVRNAHGDVGSASVHVSVAPQARASVKADAARARTPR